MQARNFAFNALGTIDCEIKHPAYGWIPFTADHGDPEPMGRDLYAQALAGELGPVAEYVAPPPPAPVVPQIVTMRQARLALLGAGLLPMVDAAIAALPSPQKEAALIEWDYSSEVHRNKPFVQTLAAALSLSTEQLDSLFTQAAQL